MWKILVLATVCALQGAATRVGLIFSTSRWWYNNRHASDAALARRFLEAQGVQDVRLWLNSDASGSPHNPFPGRLLQNDSIVSSKVWNEEPPYIDKRNDSITIDSLYTWIEENIDNEIYIYVTGHGGDGFLSLNDWYLLLENDFTWISYRKNVHWIVDSCECETLFKGMSPYGSAITSTIQGEGSLSIGNHLAVGVGANDIWTYFLYVLLGGDIPNYDYIYHNNVGIGGVGLNARINDNKDNLIRTTRQSLYSHIIRSNKLLNKPGKHKKVSQLNGLQYILNVMNPLLLKAHTCVLGDNQQWFVDKQYKKHVPNWIVI